MTLRELSNVRQEPGEPRRRWFFCHEQDLVVFENARGEICGFQLAYDKPVRERSVSWTAEHGFAHYRVEDGEGSALASNTPLLHTEGGFNRSRVLDRFRHLGQALPERIMHFVVQKLAEYDNP